jgi:hypothetical protein
VGCDAVSRASSEAYKASGGHLKATTSLSLMKSSGERRSTQWEFGSQDCTVIFRCSHGLLLISVLYFVAFLNNQQTEMPDF